MYSIKLIKKMKIKCIFYKLDVVYKTSIKHNFTVELFKNSIKEKCFDKIQMSLLRSEKLF